MSGFNRIENVEELSYMTDEDLSVYYRAVRDYLVDFRNDSGVKRTYTDDEIFSECRQLEEDLCYIHREQEVRKNRREFSAGGGRPRGSSPREMAVS